MRYVFIGLGLFGFYWVAKIVIGYYLILGLAAG